MKKVSKYYFEEYSERYFAPLMYGYIKWLHEQFKRQKIERIFFLARDGYLLKEIYDEIYPGEKTEYLYISRKAVLLPALKQIEDITDIFNLMEFPKEFSVDYFLSNAGFTNKQIKVFKNKHKDITKLTYEKVLKSNEIKNFFKENKKEHKLRTKDAEDKIKKYLKQIKFSGRVGIVDLGWYGTIQNCLKKICKKTTIVGCYFGLDPKTPLTKVEAQGYVLDQDSNSWNKNRIFNIKAIIEFHTLAHHGTTIGYSENGEPILKKYEYKSTTSETISSIIQVSTLRAIKNCNTKSNKFDNLKPLLSPSLTDAKMFGNITYEDSEMHYLAKLDKNLIKGFKESAWKNGYLKRSLKVPLPYDLITTGIRFIYGK